MKLDILAFAAHPDDAELSCSGTIIKHIELGKKAGIIDITRGELGTRGNANTRKKESEKASAIMKLSTRENLNLADGFFDLSKSSVLKVVECIRHYKPEIILANAITDRHPDHGRASKLVSEACFYAGLPKIITKRNGKEQAAWRPRAIYHYIQDRHIHPDILIDISAYKDKKMKAIKAFESQFYSQSSKEPSTPISTKDFLAFIEARMKVFGRIINVQYAEGFTIERPTGVHNLFDLY